MAKKKSAKFMQKAAASIKKRGTAGSFVRWCKGQGYSGATAQCIAAGKKSKDPGIRRKAALAGVFAKASRSRKKASK